MATVVNAKFQREFSRLIAKQKANVSQVVRKSAMQLTAKLIEMSPVDTGRFRSNWNVEMGRIDTATTDDKDPSGDASKGRAEAKIAAWKPGQTIYITNSLPYAERLEYGWSQQAPAGMVRVTVAEFQSAVSAAVKGLK